MEVFGNLNSDRNAMFVECIDQMIAIWTGEAPYRLQGRFWNISTERTLLPEIGQGIIPKPFQRPYPPIVVTAVAPHSAGITEAAARCWDPISANFLLPQWVKTHWPKYVEGCERVGRPVNPANWRVAKTIFVSDDEATAKRYGREAGGPYHFYYKQLGYKLVRAGRANLFKTSPDIPDSAITTDYLTENLVIAGTVNQVVDEILALREYVGDFGTLYYACTDWVDPALGRRSMELMAEQVMPRVNAALGQ
jgi:alkanesulfonate monooxygenase SsuD/methylene tetrahydromethanopterin reductase-like flavin-dependent oxidoreductase (luciferase family)